MTCGTLQIRYQLYSMVRFSVL